MDAFSHCDTIHSKGNKLTLCIMGVKIKVQVIQNLMTSMIPTWKVLKIVATYLFIFYPCHLLSYFYFIWLFLAVLYLLFGRSGSRGRSILLIGLTDSGKTLLFSRVSWSSCFIFLFVNRPKSTTQAYLSEMLFLNLPVIFSVYHKKFPRRLITNLVQS